MKISPIGGGSVGAVSATGPSADRVAAATAAFMGQDPKAAAAQTQQQQTTIPGMNVNRIKMRTNHSPEQFIQELQQEIEGQNTAETAVLGDNKQVDTQDVRKPISPQLAAIAKARRALQVKEQEFAAKEKALAEKMSSSQSVDMETFKANWLDILLNGGMTYEQLIEAVAAKGPGTDPKVFELTKKIADLEGKLESSFKDRDAQAEQQVLSELRREAHKITAQGDEFEAIRANGAQGKIVEFIEKQYRKTGELLDVHQAASIIEQILIDDAIKAANFNKVKSKLNSVSQTQAQPQKQQQLKTLTNRQTASPQLSRKARAIAAMNGTLKD